MSFTIRSESNSEQFKSIGVMINSLVWGGNSSSVAPYVPTPLNVVRSMLELAQASEEDVLFDLGCGDGRILLTAVEEFNVKKAVGYELNPSLYKSLVKKIEDKGFTRKIEVVNRNFFSADISKASLVTLYLTTSGNSKLKPKFEKELQTGTRIVSHDFPIRGWRTSKEESPDHFKIGSHRIYLYTVPDAYLNKPASKSDEERGRWQRIRDVIRRS